MRYYTHEEATAALPDVRTKVERIRELIKKSPPRGAGTSGNGHAPSSNGQGGDAGDTELRSLVEDLQRDGIVLRDPERGLIDFPAQSPSGREYLLCWLAGEDAIEWWHWPDAGFAGRTPLSQPPE